MDFQYQNIHYHLSEVSHNYGDNVHIISDPYLMTLLAKLGHEDTQQPLITYYVRELYEHLLKHVISHTFPKKNVQITTRMRAMHPEGIYSGEVLDADTKVVCVDIARAGILPSQVCYEKINYLLNAKNIRQDHLILSRETNEKHEVVGVKIGGAKIGGDVESAILLIADPMGATGATICHTLDYYRTHVAGTPSKIVTMHLMLTPEYIRKMQAEHPEVEIYALRLDRGFSSAKALASMPGEFWNEEKGLNASQYIVPGAGGLGEILNNSFV
ncbi:MAG: hypothetical protein KBD63_04605 [Bacteriovoracaceae bacterium]|nr:hypothetical protein [Bacteriovoracaceae bacterium]